jgi:hypothetical protein
MYKKSGPTVVENQLSETGHFWPFWLYNGYWTKTFVLVLYHLSVPSHELGD